MQRLQTTVFLCAALSSISCAAGLSTALGKPSRGKSPNASAAKLTKSKPYSTRTPEGELPERATRAFDTGVAESKAGDHKRAWRSFDSAIYQANRRGEAPAHYYTRHCEATLAYMDDLNPKPDDPDSDLKSCAAGVATSTGDAKRSAKSMRDKVARAYAAKAFAKGNHERKNERDAARANEWYSYAVRLDPSAAHHLAFCEANHKLVSENAESICTAAVKVLSGAQKKKASVYLSELKASPSKQQQALLVDVSKAYQGAHTAEAADRCLTKIEQALKAGVKNHHRLKVKSDFQNGVIHVWKNGPRYSARLDEVAATCRSLKNGNIASPLVRAFDSVALQSRSASSQDEPRMRAFVVKNAAACRKAITTARDAGLDPTMVVTYDDGKESVTFQKADTVCSNYEQHAMAKFDALDAKIKAAADKRFGPFRKVLSRDKIKLYERYANTYMQGRRGKLLKTPAQLKRARRWSFYSVDRRGLRPRWRMTTFVFKGDKLYETKVAHGVGSEPPARAFK